MAELFHQQGIIRQRIVIVLLFQLVAAVARQQDKNINIGVAGSNRSGNIIERAIAEIQMVSLCFVSLINGIVPYIAKNADSLRNVY